MSGHSKWATIKRQKGVADIKRGQTFTKLANAITIAVKAGGGITDPEGNFKLRLAIEKARSANMPRENIERAVGRAIGADIKGLEEVVYEGFAPFGVSVVVEAATDNPQRTTSEVKNIFKSAGASFGQPGSTSYQFANKGVIILKKGSKSFDEIFNFAAENGAEDIEDDGEGVLVYTDVSSLSRLRDQMSKAGFQIVSAEQARKPIVMTEVTDQLEREKVISFLDKLEELDDVQKVYSNLK